MSNGKPIRRDVLKMAGGAAAGALLTPAPWRLLGDTALWSQNWSSIPRPPRGPISTKLTRCSLCPAGCAVRARCVGEQPVSLSGAGAALCPAGLCGHHLPFHPGRFKAPERAAAALAAMRRLVREMRSSGSRESVAVLDLRPGRTASLLYRRQLAALPNGIYIEPPLAEGATLRALEMLLARRESLAFDLARARTLLSFSTPLGDGWGSPARVLDPGRPFRIVQADPRQSRAALLADAWLRIRPGSEAALALGLAGVLAREGLGDPAVIAQSPWLQAFPLARAAGSTGLAPGQIAAVARELAAHRPAVAVADGDPAAGPLDTDAVSAAAALNLLLGAAALVPRRETPAPAAWDQAVPVTSLAAVPDGSIRLLLIDESTVDFVLPWSVIAPKLAPDSVMGAVSWLGDGLASHADYALPGPVYLESFDDLPSAPDAPAASFALCVPLLKRPAATVELAELLGALADNPAPLKDALEQRAAAIHASGRGELVRTDASSTPLSGLSPQEFRQALQEGGRWQDARSEPRALGAPLPPLPPTLDAGSAPRIAAYGWRGARVSPLMSKLWQESDLRAAANQAAVHPRTGLALGLADGGRAAVRTRCGSCELGVAFDRTVLPGVIEVAAGRRLLELCEPSQQGAWNLLQAEVVRA
jgi:hypothetical protein